MTSCSIQVKWRFGRIYCSTRRPAYCLLLAGYLLGLLYGQWRLSNTLLRNVGKSLLDSNASHPRKGSSSQSPSWEIQILHRHVGRLEKQEILTEFWKGNISQNDHCEYNIKIKSNEAGSMDEDWILLIAALWIVTPRTLVDEYRGFGAIFCLQYQGRREWVRLNLTRRKDTVCSYETLISTIMLHYIIIRRPQDQNS